MLSIKTDKQAIGYKKLVILISQDKKRCDYFQFISQKVRSSVPLK